SQATAMSGPPELIPAAVAAAGMWQFEPPASAPAGRTAEVSFRLSKESPGPGSDSGEGGGNGRLLNKGGRVVAAYEDYNNPSPGYPEEERKAGVAGKLVLSVTLSAQAQLEEVHVLKTLSPGLDQAAIDVVRTWKFKRTDPNSKAP